MKPISRFIIVALVIFNVVLFFYVLLHGNNIALLNSKGLIAMKERQVMFIAFLLMLFTVIPVFFLTFFTAWKYRESNTKAKYVPDLQQNPKLEFLWWAFPAAIVLIFAVITWKATHVLDPYKPLAVATKPITIQVIALRWKWLFIYPEQHIATVNFIQFPEHTPINFELTADAPMNSFWIPQLSGQIYAMPGMSTQLHIITDVPGDFAGSAAEISGRGFAGMKFIARASSQADFDAWVQSVQASSKILDLSAYNKLAQPSENDPVTFYALSEDNLYNKIIMKFMAPSSTNSGGTMQNMPGM